MRYFLNIAYDGTNYQGWQRQKNVSARTVQEEIEKVLFRFFKKEITVFGCGRTDAGVHSSQYVMHINLDKEPEFDLKFRMNKNLPDSIAVQEIVAVSKDQHCRYNAISRTYDYFLHWKKDSLQFRTSSFYEYPELNFALMQKAAELIGRTSDFKAVCKQPDLYKNTICHITNCILIVNEEQGRLRFSITGSRFLRGMVRYCVFFLLEVGQGKLGLEDFELILKQELTFVKKKGAYPNGLFLSKIEYDFIDFTVESHHIKMLKMGLEPR